MPRTRCPREDGARSDFYGGGRDKLHDSHLVHKGVTRSCLGCHFDIHCNRKATTTQYRWISGGVATSSTAPPPGVKSHLVNFAPDVKPLNFGLPCWQIDTDTGRRQCDLACHGSGNRTDRVNCQPPAGDEPPHAY
jgi:hypothetical protein